MNDIGTQIRQQLHHLQNRIESPSYDLVSASISRYRHHHRRRQRGAILTAAFLIVIVSALSAAIALTARHTPPCLEAQPHPPRMYYESNKVERVLSANDVATVPGCNRQ